MVEDRIGYRYAKSIFGLAAEQKILAQTVKDMRLINKVSTNSPDFVNMLKSPLIHADAKQKIIDRIFGNKIESRVTNPLLKLIISKRREQFLPHIAKAFMDLYDKAKGIERGVLTSAVELSSEEAEAIREVVAKELGKKFEMETAVDPDLIGGFSLKIGDRLFDGSVSGSLRRLKQEMGV